ncbi:MAG: RagB/SusD family nutrient uptake outer membrane protein [Muribaculaceae bacterium]|nr:RagB/SusD family nutrient uptake outer membrane protein [Muribaculaceae bacterium]
MKKNIIINGIAGCLLLGGAASCADDYLDLAPVTSVSTDMIHTSIEGAENAVTGLYRSMYMQYGDWDANNRFVNGEAWMMTFYGDVFSPDAFYNIWAPFGVQMYGWSVINDKDTWIPGRMWSYCYNLINQANQILVGIDTMNSGTEQRRQAVKAQALTMRAHAYIHLLQLYAPRWEDSENGSKKVLVLRTVPGDGDMGLSTQAEAMELVYSDLEEAIRLFEDSRFSRQGKYAVDKSVAQGLFARAAMMKNDWQKAYDMAKAARSGYAIMSSDTYKAGFVDETTESMWNNPLDPQWMYYYSWGSIYSTTGVYACYGAGFGAGSMSYDLYKQMDANDVRRELYFMPDKSLRRPLTSASFWNASIIDETTMNLNGKNANMNISLEAFGNKVNPDPNRFVVPYSNEAGTKLDASVIVPFGAQYKFWGEGIYAIQCFPFMRASEMALYEAEAAYRLGKIAEAQAALTDVNSNRIANYTCTSTGQALMDEIMFTSRVELWGEGHTWINMKRWNVSAVRRPWVAGDVESNNVPAQFQINKSASDNRGWVYTIPRVELDYNHAIRIDEVVGLIAKEPSKEE